jgi:ornithine carbamoyltransferase
MTRHFLDLATAGREGLRAILDEAHRRKAARAGKPKGMADVDAPLAGHVLASIFEKPSTRTRVSFDIAMRQLGGSALVLSPNDMQLGRGETIADTARVLSRYIDAIMLRCAAHSTVEELARYASVPVINGLTDLSHPCQIMADIMTVEERLGRPVTDTRWAWLGDGNNVLNSIIEAGSLLGFEVRVATPQNYEPDSGIVACAQARGGQLDLGRDAGVAVDGADVVVTDTWVSMGQKGGADKVKAMMPYQVTPELMGRAASDALFLHCLPAHRGEEVLDTVMDGPQSAVWDEAENRLHAQKAILLWCFGHLG